MTNDPRNPGRGNRLLRILTHTGSATFFRTFILLASLVVGCMVAIFAAYRLLDEAPPEQRLAWEIASIVNITRSALLGSDPARRMLMLEELAKQEEVRVVPLEVSDRIDVTKTTPAMAKLEARLRMLLTDTTMVAARVNDEDGLWVSFDIAGDGYWLLLPVDRADRQLTPSLDTIVLIAAAVASVGALAIAWFVDRPLSQLSRAIAMLGRGQRPPRLSEEGPPQLSRAKRQFNKMANDLAELENDRSVALAGISHDLRTPLTRLRLEIEMASIDEAQREAMVEDIQRIDAIVGQFVDYARTNQQPKARHVSASDTLTALALSYDTAIRAGRLSLTTRIAGQTQWTGDPTDLQRIGSNLIDNAIRYGKAEQDTGARVELGLDREQGGLRIVVRDFGPGIPDPDLAEVVRPFARLDAARTNSPGSHAGTGLGLAIVARICSRYGGELELSNAPGGGLQAVAKLPDWKEAPQPG